MSERKQRMRLVRQANGDYCLFVSRPLRTETGGWVPEDQHERPIAIPPGAWEEMTGVNRAIGDDPVTVMLGFDCRMGVDLRSAGEPAPPDRYRFAGYESGTVNVELVSERGPWLTFYDRSDARRQRMAVEIADFLNGKSDYPEWMWDFHRTSAEVLKTSGGATCIHVTGPMVDTNPPHGNWQVDRSNAAIMSRNDLMNRIDPSKVRAIG